MDSDNRYFVLIENRVAFSSNSLEAASAFRLGAGKGLLSGKLSDQMQSGIDADSTKRKSQRSQPK